MCTRAMRSENDAVRGYVCDGPLDGLISHWFGRFNVKGQLWLPTRRTPPSLFGCAELEDGELEAAFQRVSDTCTKFMTSVTEEVIWPTTCRGRKPAG